MSRQVNYVGIGDGELEHEHEHSDETGGRPRWQIALGVCIVVAVVVALVLIIVIPQVLVIRESEIGPLFHTTESLASLRPANALEAEAKRREAAIKEGKLLTTENLPNVYALAQNIGSSTYFPSFNFVQGFKQPGFWNEIPWIFSRNHDKFRPPVKGETVGVLSYQDYAKQKWGVSFQETYFNDFYTGGHVPSWEDNEGHSSGVKKFDLFVKASRAMGKEPVDSLRGLEPRFAFDHEALVRASWDGFRYMGPTDIKYASNGVYGIAVLEQLMVKYNSTGDVLGLLMTDSVFSAHLKIDKPLIPILGQSTKEFHVDLSSMEGYAPIPGYAPLGGKAAFVEDGQRLRTVRLEYGGKIYTDFDVPEVDQAFIGSKRTGWRFAEAAIICSLLSMTNLVMHVKDLHLELAAAFQAVTVDAFAGEPSHPVRRLLDPFISRSVQATNDNFKLLFEYHAADFSLAPLPHDVQLKLIGDAVKNKPLNLADMDMERFAEIRNIDPEHSTASAVSNTSRWGWRWHYRALTVQRLYDKLVTCWLQAHFSESQGGVDGAIANDGVLQAWWQAMLAHIPSLRRASVSNTQWASADKLTTTSLRNVARTLMVWLSWIHEDVGHSAAAYVYNPVYTPMCVPEDGVGVPLVSWNWNSLAYRGFVFLHRATLLEEPPDFWFAGNAASRQCFSDFQASLKSLGQSDIAFSECDKAGFYSCVDRVETAVSS